MLALKQEQLFEEIDILPIDLKTKEGDTIHGFLFYSHNLESHWKNLDSFEGEE